MAPVTNFFTMMYIDDIVICLGADEKCLLHLNSFLHRKKVWKQNSKKKYKGELGMFENFWQKSCTMPSKIDSHVPYLQELNEKELVDDLVEDRVIKYHGHLES